MKYKTEVYTSNYSFTPYDRVISNQNFVSDIPKMLETSFGSILLFDEDSCFYPRVDVYSEFVKKKQWKHCKRTDWYTHELSGIKVKLEIIRSPSLDHKNPGMGWEKQTLTVKIPIPQSDGRGKNPNSHNNKPRIIDGVIRDIKLTPEQWSQVEALGNGKGYSQGIRNLLQNI